MLSAICDLSLPVREPPLRPVTGVTNARPEIDERYLSLDGPVLVPLCPVRAGDRAAGRDLAIPTENPPQVPDAKFRLDWR
jgi:hypothetical protein